MNLFRELEHNIYQPTELSRKELNLKQKLDSLRVKQKSIKDKIEAAEKTCEHKVFYDERGFIHDLRYCGVCGLCIEMI